MAAQNAMTNHPVTIILGSFAVGLISIFGCFLNMAYKSSILVGALSALWSNNFLKNF